MGFEINRRRRGGRFLSCRLSCCLGRFLLRLLPAEILHYCSVIGGGFIPHREPESVVPGHLAGVVLDLGKERDKGLLDRKSVV